MKDVRSDVGMAVAKPLYGQVREGLLGRIKQGEWKLGDMLPNEFALAEQFDVSVGTIRRAMEELCLAGVVVRKQGRGTYVTGAGTKALQERFMRLRSASGRPLQLNWGELSVETRAPTATEKFRLLLNDDARVFAICQVVRSTARVIGIERSAVPAAQLPGLQAALTAPRDLYEMFSEQGILVAKAEENVRVGIADAAMAVQLQIPQGQAILVVERLAFGTEGTPIEFRQSTYVASDIVYAARI